MQFNSFNKPKREKSDDCKIKIKKTNSGKQIEFSGSCSKEQIQVAKENLQEELRFD